jgi:hypothetical protein
VRGERAVGDTLVCFASRCDVGGCRGVCGDQVGASLADCNDFKSLKEERRFLRGGPAEEGTVSEIAPNAAPKNPDRLLCGLGPFSNGNAPKTVGRSRDDGRLGERYMAASTEPERASG